MGNWLIFIFISLKRYLFISLKSHKDSAEAVMKILDHSDLDVPHCVPAVSVAESIYLYICGITAKTLPAGVCYKVKVNETEHSIVTYQEELFLNYRSPRRRRKKERM
uniref:6-pyruvoyltetrahydropterin synthase n=1 Tax=Moschus moschiferus TaxID=68415 RepID=A0A8C6DK41_MOSMO